MIGSMAAVLALVAVCAWVLRRWRDRHGPENGSIEIVSGITLGSKERIVLLRVGDEQVLVGVSPAGMRSLHIVRQGGAVQREAAAAECKPAAPGAPAEFRLSLGAVK
jgi:flagellar protein FliO/FliZ